jgi:hypothetical protein
VGNENPKAMRLLVFLRFLLPKNPDTFERERPMNIQRGNLSAISLKEVKYKLKNLEAADNFRNHHN